MKITQEMLEELNKIFVLKEFSEDRKIYVLADFDKYSSYFIHDDEWDADDYVYKWAAYAIDDIYEKLPPGEYSEDELHDMFDEIIDELEADIYTWDLTAWLHSSNTRVYYLTEALEDQVIEDGFQLLSYAQIIEKREIYYMTFRIVMKILEDMQEDEDE